MSVQPFSNGSQYGDWQDRNCTGCWKSSTNRDPDKPFHRFNCQIDKALGEAYWGDGQVSDEIANRMGLDPKSEAYTWQCPEREEQRPPRPRKAPAIEQTPLFKHG